VHEAEPVRLDVLFFGQAFQLFQDLPRLQPKSRITCKPESGSILRRVRHTNVRSLALLGGEKGGTSSNPSFQFVGSCFFATSIRSMETLISFTGSTGLSP
jgi:hypothetical protein